MQTVLQGSKKAIADMLNAIDHANSAGGPQIKCLGTTGRSETFYRITDREHATVLAALRYWQREGGGSSGHEHDIATNGGTVQPLDDHEIDALCERLNCGG